MLIVRNVAQKWQEVCSVARSAAERKRIAEAFRDLEKEELQHSGGFKKSELFEIERITGLYYSGAKTIYGRLADLIEPEEEEERGTSWWTICDECGTIFNKAISKNGVAYCPDCGTKKVVGDAD